MDTKNQRFIFSLRSYCVCTPQGFVIKCFPIFIVDEVKNFAANNIVQVAIVSHVPESMQRFSHRLEICTSRKRRLLQDQVQLDIGAKVQLQVGISEQARVVGKIPYTCNHLIFDQWILGSGDLKTTQYGFSLARSFPHLSTNYRVNLTSVAFSLIGDLLVPSRFA